MTIVLTWDADDDVTLYAGAPCGQSATLSESGPRTKTYVIAQVYAGEYAFRAFYYGLTVPGQPPAPSANITATVTVEGETTLVFQGTVPPRISPLAPPNHFDFSYSTPYVSDIGVAVNSTYVYDAQGTGFSVFPTYNCTFNRWYPETDSVTLIVVSGSEFGKFAVGDNPARDTAVTRLVNEFSDVRFIPSGRLGTYPVEIEARVKSIVARTSVIVRYCSILLGETKHFYCIEEDGWEEEPPRLLRIYETGSTELPAGASTGHVWTVANYQSHENSGRKLGVYWEREKPIPGGSGSLPTGMIRLVGRYWHADSVYNVWLLAVKARIGGRIAVGVEKPARLGNSYDARSRDRGIDIEGSLYSVDSVCIKWGGIYGFPPQNIKGQYQSESVFDPALRAYTPAYRYEPWSAEFWDQVQRLRPTSHFWVTHENMGDGDAVPDHQNLRYMTYVNTPHSVWYFIEQYSTVVHDNPPAGYSLFGSFHPSDGRLTFRYPRPRELYRQVRTPIYIRFGLDTLAQNLQANQLARQRFIQYGSTQYLGGLNNRPAQSRIASSYGPLQPMYTTALDRAYPNGAHDRPENLNDLNIFFPFAMAHHVFLLTQQVSDINSNNWEAGFEETMRRVYHRWNNRNEYDAEVLRNARQYTPVR